MGDTWTGTGGQNVSMGTLGDDRGILQRRLDFTPAASELAQALRSRETRAQKMLARLRLGPATSIELAEITHRFSARIFELRASGHKISREDHAHGGHEWSVYRLEE